LGRMGRLLPLALVAAAAVIATLAVNFLLVGYAQNRDDPVGKLSPRALLTETGSGPTTTTGTTTTGTTTGGTTTDATTTDDRTTTDDDDSSGRGRGRNRGRGGDDDD
jgi:hypothetical protein